MSNLKSLISELHQQNHKIDDMIKSGEYSERAVAALQKLKASKSARLAQFKQALADQQQKGQARDK